MTYFGQIRKMKKGSIYTSLHLSTWLNISYLIVPGAGLEPARTHHPRDYKYFVLIAYLFIYQNIQQSVFLLIPWMYHKYRALLGEDRDNISIVDGESKFSASCILRKCIRNGDFGIICYLLSGNSEPYLVWHVLLIFISKIP